VGGQVPEDGVVGLGFAARPFTVALERLDLHTLFDGSLSHRPIEGAPPRGGGRPYIIVLAYLNRQSGR
jgi:hypothetical protein